MIDFGSNTTKDHCVQTYRKSLGEESDRTEITHCGKGPLLSQIHNQRGFSCSIACQFGRIIFCGSWSLKQWQKIPRCVRTGLGIETLNWNDQTPQSFSGRTTNNGAPKRRFKSHGTVQYSFGNRRCSNARNPTSFEITPKVAARSRGLN